MELVTIVGADSNDVHLSNDMRHDDIVISEGNSGVKNFRIIYYIMHSKYHFFLHSIDKSGVTVP